MSLTWSQTPRKGFLVMWLNYKIPKYPDTGKIAVIILQFEQCVYHRVMSQKDADGMANSVDPDQTAPLGAV